MIVAAGACAWAEDIKVDANLTVGKKSGATETTTLVQPVSGGGVVAVSQETVKDTEPVRMKTEVPADLSPRKARVVVMPATYAQDVRSRFQREIQEKFGVGDMGILENPGYTSHLVDALVNCRKFDVLEREALGSAIKEINFGESDYADAAKVVRIGQMLNADYVVIPEIRYINVIALSKEIPYVGDRQLQYRGKVSAQIRTVDVKTSKIVASAMGETALTNRVRRMEESPALPIKDFIAKLYAESAREEAARIIDAAYPIKVVAVTENTCVINRGLGAIAVGETLGVYSPGEIMVDPDTKESLGYQEMKLGTIKVVKVDPKTSTAVIIEGVGRVKKLNICRRELGTALPVEAPAPKID
jgi:curli biogenesis system outer membrane secretion channel CsgG